MATSKDELILSCQIPKNKTGIIKRLSGPAELVQRLRELGFREDKVVKKTNGNEEGCIMVNLDGVKIALNEQAAHCILVKLL